MEDVHA
jgi:hypothetical protein